MAYGVKIDLGEPFYSPLINRTRELLAKAKTDLPEAIMRSVLQFSLCNKGHCDINSSDASAPHQLHKWPSGEERTKRQ